MNSEEAERAMLCNSTSLSPRLCNGSSRWALCMQGEPALVTTLHDQLHLPRLLTNCHLFLQDEWEVLLDEYDGLISTNCKWGYICWPSILSIPIANLILQHFLWKCGSDPRIRCFPFSELLCFNPGDSEASCSSPPFPQGIRENGEKSTK